MSENRLDMEPVLFAPDVYALIADAIDVTRWRPVLARGVETIKLPLSGGDSYAVAANPDRSVHFRLTSDEAALLEHLDGSTTVADLIVRRLTERGELDSGEVVQLLRALHAQGFLSERRVDVYAQLERALHPPTISSRADRLLRTLTIEWSGAEQMVSRLYRSLLRHAFNPVGAFMVGLVAVAGVIAFVDVRSTHHFRLTNRHFGVAFLVLLALDLAIIFIHELGHATVLVHYRRRVRGAGFRIYFGAPSFFINSGDALMLTIPRRIFQSAAGPIFELVGTSTAALFLWAFPSGAAGRTLYQFIIINYFVLFLNLVPMLELDGYWILSDALHQPDLRPQSLVFVRREMWRKLRHHQKFSRKDLGLAAFGTAGVIFTIAALASAWFFWRRVFGDTMLAMWRGGVAGKLLLIALLLILGGPALRSGVIVVRSVLGRIRALTDRIRFRFESSWRVEAATLLDESMVFGDVPVDILNDIAGRVELKTFPYGAVVTRQGDISDAYYIIRKGSVEVVEEFPGGPTRALNRVGPGGGFGEQGILEGSPRSATVRTVGRTELFRIDGSTFQRLLTDRASTTSFAPTIQQIEELGKLPPFASLGSERLADLVRRGRWDDVAPGEAVFTQGDVGDAFYVLDHGRLEVSVDGRAVRELNAGDYFGELALLLQVPRTASVRALTPARLFEVDRAAFDSLVAEQFVLGDLEPTVRVEAIRDH